MMRGFKWAQAGLAMLAVAGCTEVPGGGLPTETSQVASSQAELVTVTKVVTKGAAIDVGWSDELTQGFVMAGTDTTNKVSSAFLTATQVVFDPASQVCVSDPAFGSYCHYTRVAYDAIYANFPPANLSIGANTATLNVNLNTATNLTFTRCVYDETTVTTTCSDLTAPGSISLKWQKTAADYVKSFGVTETKTGPQTVRVTGTRASFSADVTGSFVGTALSHKPGTMGTNNTITIDILRTP